MSNLLPTPGGSIGPWNGPGQRPRDPRAPEPDPEAIDLREVLAVLRRHAWLVAACTLLALAGAGALVLRQQPQYRATATIRLKDVRQAMTGAIETPGLEQMLGKTVDPLLSQLEVMRSRTVAGEVVRRTGLRLQPLDDGLSHDALTNVTVDAASHADTLTFVFAPHGYTVQNGNGRALRAAYGESAELAGASFTVPTLPADTRTARVAVLGEETAIERVQKQLRAAPLEKTDVVTVSYTDPDPVRARAVVNTAIAVFKEQNADEAQQLSRRRRVFVEEQLGKTDSVLADAQAALSEFRRREQVFSSREKFAAQQTDMLQLDLRREELTTERQVHARLLQALRTAGPNVTGALRAFMGAPGVASNPVMPTLYQQLVRYQAARDSLTTGRWGSATTNPDVQRLDALITQTRQELIDAAASQLSTIDARLASLTDLQGRHSAGLQAQPEKEAEEMRLMRRVETAGRLADQLREEFQKAQIAEAVEAGQVDIVDVAPLPLEPIGSGRPLKLGLALMLGLMVGSGAAFLREHLNTTITRKDEMEALLGVASLALIPRITVRSRRQSLPALHLPVRMTPPHVERPLESLVTVSQGHSTGAEAYRSLRTNLLFSQSLQQLQSVLITSPMAAEGKTVTAANLAVAFAQQGLRVLLVDCDLRKARVHSAFGMSRTPGLTDAITGDCTIEEIVRPVAVPGLSVITAGTLPPSPAELLGSEPMRRLLDEIRSRADLILFDAPPVLVAGDASILSRLVDGVVLVIRAGQTQRAAAEAAMQQLHIVGARVVGAVLNDPDAKVPSYDGYAYYAYRYYEEAARRA